MSWQRALLGSGHVDLATIVGFEDQAIWASSKGFVPSADEIKEIISGLKQTNLDKLRVDGLYIAGERYVLTKSEDRTLIVRKGKEGVVIVKSKKAILIAHYNESMLATNCSFIVEGLADYLEKQGY
ncbi:Profilin [Erysiphe neolycopersici]|uniref:Profilin n=1 Tax=Erysiphe neolycopersici TaxID=212602 RepID=A0A420HYW8_9PEZI|nr:Profilin [Erysiphe neolycopersici]